MERFGPNALPEAAGPGLLVRMLRQFHHPLIYVLLVAGVITAGLQEFVDSAVIFGVVVVNAVVGFIQESKAEAALEGLRSMVRTQAKVVRDGHEHTVPSEELVPGDLVLLEAGDKVPADVRLLRETELRVNESALTGESAPVHKDEVVLPEPTPVADRRNMAYSGTLVTAGSGVGVVVATGAETELGEIHRLVGAAEILTTPLTAKLVWFSKILTIGILGLAALTLGVGLLRRQDARRNVHRRDRAGGRRHPRRPAGRGHDHAGHRCGANGQAASGHSAPACGGDVGQHHGHLRRQDWNTDREPDDGPGDLDPRRRGRGDRNGLCPRRCPLRGRRCAGIGGCQRGAAVVVAGRGVLQRRRTYPGRCAPGHRR